MIDDCHGITLVKIYYKNKQNFTYGKNYYFAMNDDAKNLARNLKRLMAYYKHEQTDLARIAKLSQKTISNMLNPGDERSPVLLSIAAVAQSYKLKTWHLLIDNAADELLFNVEVEKLVSNFNASENDDKETIMKVSETMARYGKKPKMNSHCLKDLA